MEIFKKEQKILAREIKTEDDVLETLFLENVTYEISKRRDTILGCAKYEHINILDIVLNHYRLYLQQIEIVRIFESLKS